MKLPNGDKAVVDDAKLRDYCLSTSHPRGRHKARLFSSLLGITIAEIDVLRAALLAAARDAEVAATRRNAFGQIYELRFEMTGPSGSATIVSAWMVEDADQIPRLVTCYPL